MRDSREFSAANNVIWPKSGAALRNWSLGLCDNPQRNVGFGRLVATWEITFTVYCGVTKKLNNNTSPKPGVFPRNWF